MLGRARAVVIVVAFVLVIPCVRIGAEARGRGMRVAVGSFHGGFLPSDPAAHVPRNRDYEPGASVAPDGSIWITASVQFFTPSDDPRDKVISGADIWRSRDGGRTFQWVADPADLTGSDAEPGPGGGDSDIAAAAAFNADGTFNVYAVTNWAGSATVSISRDSGRTWTTTPLGAPPNVDRPWVAADGACRFYVVYKVLGTVTAEVSVRYDVCPLPGASAGTTAVAPEPASPIQLLGSAGKPAVDNSATSPYRHSLYVPVMGCDPASGGSGCLGTVSADLEVSRDGGLTFTSSHLADGPGTDVGIFPQVATDRSGTVYMTWGDFSAIALGVSTDGGRTWRPKLIDTSGFDLAALPQVAGGRAGEVVLSWYGIPAGTSDVEVYVARSIDRGQTFHLGRASPVIHVGTLCSTTGAQGEPNCNDLRDDFGLVIQPGRFNVTVAYTTDVPEGDRSHDSISYATEEPGLGA